MDNTTVNEEATVVPKRPQPQLDEYGNTPMHFAADEGRIEEVLVEIEIGYGVNRRNHLGWTPLMMAAVEGHLDVVQLLLERGADTSQANAFGASVFQMAIASGNLEIVQLILNHLLCGGVSRQSMETFISPATIAILFDQEHILSYLLQSSFRINISAPNTGLTPLMFAAVMDNKKLFNMLIAHGVDVKITNVNGQSAIDLRINKEKRYLPALTQRTQMRTTQLQVQSAVNTPKFHFLEVPPPNSAPIPVQYHHPIPQYILTPDYRYHGHYEQPQHQVVMPIQNGYIMVPGPHVLPCMPWRRGSNLVESPCCRSVSPIVPAAFMPPQVFFPPNFETVSPGAVFSPAVIPLSPMPLPNELLEQHVYDYNQ